MAIKNIIFDFGGVVLDIDEQLTINEFLKLGLDHPEKAHSSEFTELVRKFERGIFTPDIFRNRLRNLLDLSATDQEIDDAWNALLYDIPAERIKIIEQAKKNYNIFLLSNSNEIHYDLYVRDLQLRFGYKEFAELFHQAYFSFDLHLSKPHQEIFEFIIFQEGLNPSETLFIDDKLENVETASKLGLHVYQLIKPERIRDIFSKGKFKK
ncbi:MAG: HAD family phosphatase [Chlorobi bacterium]|nr:HAD family phosphatase [Chlorobiota bacterium]